MLGVSTFSIILFDLDKFDLLLGLVLFLGFYRFCTVFLGSVGGEQCWE